MTDWNQRWLTGDTPWDKGAPAPPLLELLDSEYRDRLIGQRVLIPGCGSGHDVRALAAEGAKAIGLDISGEAVAHARTIVAVGEIDFLHGSFFDMDLTLFDAVWEHTCFCAIDLEDRPRYAAACARLIRPGGVLAGVFYLEPWLPGEKPDPPPHPSKREEIVELLTPHFELLWDKIPSRAYPGREGREWLAVFQRSVSDRGVAE